MAKQLKDMDWHEDDRGVIQNTGVNLDQTKELLDSTGCGFCLAKFRQTTLHLGTGMVHACHHPTPHKIPLDEIENNPAALFNTTKLKNARKEMLTGSRPAECDYCWRIEDENNQSDRFYKSVEPWALNDHDEIAKLTGDEDIFPSYLEVSFDNTCNLKCTYCGPEFSSKWVEELKQHGPLKILDGTPQESWVQGWQDLETLKYKNREFNPYVDAFWKWFPDAYPHLKNYRITGGEPLLSKETFKSMDWLIENPNDELEFSINSNFSVPDKLWDKFIDKLTIMRDNDSVKKITIYTSIEGWGERAEYARTGLDFNLFKQRVEQLAEMDNIRCVIMAAYNIFSVTSFTKLLEWIHKLKIEYNPNNTMATIQHKTGFRVDPNVDYIDRRDRNKSHAITIGIDVPYLRHPEVLDTHFILDGYVEKFMFPSLEFMSRNRSNDNWTYPGGFEHYELEKFKRIISHRIYFNGKNNDKRDSDDDIITARAGFYDFVNELDKRRGTDFLTVFPEMEEFYNVCKKCKDLL